jgi:hypothetical protein
MDFDRMIREVSEPDGTPLHMPVEVCPCSVAVEARKMIAFIREYK